MLFPILLKSVSGPLDFVKMVKLSEISKDHRGVCSNFQSFKVPTESGVGEGGLNAVRGASGQYEEMARERAHEAAIFGIGRSQPLDSSLSLGTRPGDDGIGGNSGGPKIVPTTQVVKEIIHPRVSSMYFLILVRK